MKQPAKTPVSEGGLGKAEEVSMKDVTAVEDSGRIEEGSSRAEQLLKG